MNCGRIESPTFLIFHPFGCVCYFLNTKDHLHKFDSKAHKCFLLGYFERSKGYRVYNTEKLIIENQLISDLMISLAIKSQSTLKILQIQKNNSQIMMIQKIKMLQKSHQTWR